MPRADLLIESPVADSFRVEQVRGMFDMPPDKSVRHEWHVELPIEDQPWQIGMLVGPSGSGKTTLGRRLFPEAYFHERFAWKKEAAIVDCFPAQVEMKAIVKALSSVGFSSPPHWLKRYAHLSNGQKFRCDLARLLASEFPLVVFDEFSSIVDRDAAKVSSAAVAKAIRRKKTGQFIALSCHYDVIDWLDPDWVFDVPTGTLTWRRLRRRPPVELQIFESSPAAWPAFREHHYLTGSLHRAARCFVALWGESPVGFTSYMQLPSNSIRRLKREHRTVVLPDFQGLGIGNALSEWLGEHVAALGFGLRSVTSHPAMITHRCASPRWRLARMGRMPPFKADSLMGKQGSKSSRHRITASFAFIPSGNSTQNSPNCPRTGNGSIGVTEESSQAKSASPGMKSPKQAAGRSSGRKGRQPTSRTTQSASPVGKSP